MVYIKLGGGSKKKASDLVKHHTAISCITEPALDTDMFSEYGVTAKIHGYSSKFSKALDFAMAVDRYILLGPPLILNPVEMRGSQTRHQIGPGSSDRRLLFYALQTFALVLVHECPTPNNQVLS